MTGQQFIDLLLAVDRWPNFHVTRDIDDTMSRRRLGSLARWTSVMKHLIDM